MQLFCDGAVERFKNDGDQIMTFGAFNLFEGLNVVMFGAVHNRKDFRDKTGFFSRPVTSRTSIKRFHNRSLVQ